MVAIARDVVLTTPSVALASDSTRLACRSPSNRPLTKRLTPGKPRVRSGVIDRPADRVACGESHRSRGCGNRFMSGGRLRIRSARHESFQKAGTPLLILLLCASDSFVMCQSPRRYEGMHERDAPLNRDTERVPRRSHQ